MTITPHFERFISLSASDRYTCGLRQNGTHSCWGDGQLEGAADEELTALSIGTAHTCGIRRDGSPLCWGDGYETSTTDVRLDTLDALGNHTSVAISSEVRARLRPARRRNSRLLDLVRLRLPRRRGAGPRPTRSWYPSAAEGPTSADCVRMERLSAGAAKGPARSSPRRENGSQQISSGFGYVCALREDGRAVLLGRRPAWTGIAAGETSGSRRSPPVWDCATSIPVLSGRTGAPSVGGADQHGQASPPENERFSSISAGGSHTCALRIDDGTAVCWGLDSEAQSSPPPGEAFSAITSGRSHTLRAAPGRRSGRVLGSPTGTMSTTTRGRRRRPMACVSQPSRGPGLHVRGPARGCHSRLLGVRLPPRPA